jgi:hypothetical protein
VDANAAGDVPLGEALQHYLLNVLLCRERLSDQTVMDGMSYRGEEPINLEQLRERLHRMTDEELLCFGKAARFMCREVSPADV